MTPFQITRRHPEVLLGLLVAAGLAWWWTAARTAGMADGPGTNLGTIGWFSGSWAAMMAAMMLPSLAPTLSAYLAAWRRQTGLWLPFVGGYLLVWTAAGIGAYAILAAGKGLLAGELAWHSGGRWLAGAVIAAAGAYELFPVKRTCLARCRELEGPPGGLRHGWSGALAMGARSGGWCVGSSGALMAALFALGVMSLTWMALASGLVALQKIGPWPAAGRLLTAAVLVALGVGMLVAPHAVPGLVLPGSASGHAMGAMG
jgi:predicted metal-binding membrane protein